MEIVDIEDENLEIQKQIVNKGWKIHESSSNESSDYNDTDRFMVENTFEATGISPWYIGKFLKDTVRNDVRVWVNLCLFSMFFAFTNSYIYFWGI